MTKSEVMALLQENQNDRGIKHWEKLGAGTGGLKSFGIGLTQLRKLAKKIGRDHQLALQLWKANYVDAKTIGLLIDEPKKMTPEQVEQQVEQTGAGMLAHVLSSCDATLSKTSFAFDLAAQWIESKHDLRRQCGYGLVYELSKNQKDLRLTDDFFLGCIDRIDKTIEKEVSDVRLAMGGALMGIGKRNKKLNKAAVTLAKRLGPIDYDTGDTACEPLDVLKHLTTDALKKKLGA